MDEETLDLSLSLVLEFDFQGELLGVFTRPKLCGSNRTEIMCRNRRSSIELVRRQRVDMSSAPDSLLV